MDCKFFFFLLLYSCIMPKRKHSRQIQGATERLNKYNEQRKRQKLTSERSSAVSDSDISSDSVLPSSLSETEDYIIPSTSSATEDVFSVPSVSSGTPSTSALVSSATLSTSASVSSATPSTSANTCQISFAAAAFYTPPPPSFYPSKGPYWQKKYKDDDDDDGDSVLSDFQLMLSDEEEDVEQEEETFDEKGDSIYDACNSGAELREMEFLCKN